MSARALLNNLRVIEIDSSFAFRLYGGLGASLFIADNAAIYAQYLFAAVNRLPTAFATPSVRFIAPGAPYMQPIRCLVMSRREA